LKWFSKDWKESRGGRRKGGMVLRIERLRSNHWKSRKYVVPLSETIPLSKERPDIALPSGQSPTLHSPRPGISTMEIRLGLAIIWHNSACSSKSTLLQIFMVAKVRKLAGGEK